MKKIFLVSSLLATTYSFGQPVLGDSTLPKEGTRYLVHGKKNDWAWNYKGNDTGRNVFWNFFYDKYDEAPYVQIFDKPSDLSITYEADTANLARGNQYSYTAYWVDSAGLRTVEVRYGDGLKYYYAPPGEIEIPTPFPFRGTFSDTSIENIGYSQGNIIRVNYKKIIKKYDGYGSLQVGEKTFENVARVSTDITEFLVSDADTSRFFIKLYQWYSNDLGIPVYEIFKSHSLVLNEDDSGNLIYDTFFSNASSFIFDTTSLSGLPIINKRADHFGVFTRGSSLIIINEGENNETIIYELIDAAGRKLISGKERIGSQEIDVSTFKKGIYLLQLTDKKSQTESHKIILK